MHKQIVRFGLVVTVLVGFLCLSFISGKLGAVDAPDLVSATQQLDVQKSPDVPSVPSSLNGNVDCIQDGPYDCVIDTSYGKFSSSGYVKRNKTSSYYQLISYVDNRAHSIAIPNSNTIINYTTEPPYGFYLYFTKNLSSSVTKTEVFGTSQYNINRLYDGRLVDRVNHRLAADYTSMSFSANGQWMVISMPNVAMLRVNLDTFEVVPFAAGFSYTIGSDPGIKTAISNDGRYATVASKTFTRFDVYDLNTCAAVPDTINGPVACQSRNLQSVMQQKVPGYISVGQVRFVNDNTLRLYADYNNGAGHKIAPFAINPAGTGAHQHDYLALGDSYISGEGSYNYLQGTDTADNKCHVSLLSYPYLLAHDLNYNSFHSVACSGAKMKDITDTSKQYEGQARTKTKRGDYSKGQIDSFLGNFQPGYIDQLDFVTTYQPQVITLSVGGNDVGFSGILASCISPLNLATCYSTYEDRLELVRQINAQFPSLVSTYQTLKKTSSPDTRIYAIGYPQIVKPGGDCRINVQLNADELVFAQQFTSYLDDIIQQAAAKAGVFYVDTQNALNGHRLCEARPGEFAVNGLTRGTDYPQWFGGIINGPLGDETYHPTPLGYSLLRDSVAAATASLSAMMPTPDSSAAAPTETGLDILNEAHSGRTVSATSYENSLSGDILLRGSASDIFVGGLENSLKPATSYRAELHSSPTVLGNFTSTSSGNLSFQVTIPSSVPAGFHSLHIYGTNVAGEAVDIYKTVYVAASGDDYNGNGIPNSSDPCVFVDASGQDYDQDGIDDACDGNITNPPPAVPAPTPPITNNNPPGGPTQTLQPSVGLPSTDPATLILAPSDPVATPAETASAQTQNSSTAIVTTSSSAPPTATANEPILGGQDFLASYYSLPTPNKSSVASTPKVLGTRTDSSPTHTKSPQKILTQKILIGSIVAILAVFSGTMLARKIRL